MTVPVDGDDQSPSSMYIPWPSERDIEWSSRNEIVHEDISVIAMLIVCVVNKFVASLGLRRRLTLVAVRSN